MDTPVEVSIEEVKDSAPGAEAGSVVLQTESRVDGERRDTSIEVQEEDIPTIAVALLNADADANGGSSTAGLPPAMRCLAAGVVHIGQADQVRVHLQFDSGQVLPIEMSLDAAVALCRGLMSHTGLAHGADPAPRA